MKSTDTVNSFGLHVLYNICAHYKSLYTFHVRRNKVVTAEETDEPKKGSNRPDRF